MSVDKHFEKRGVRLTDDNALPQGQRTQRNVKRVIAAVRAAESEFNEELRAANARATEAQEQVILLQRKVHELGAELQRLRLNDVSERIESLTVADRRELLEVVK